MKSRLVLANAEEEMILIKYDFRPTSFDTVSSGELVTDGTKAVTLNRQNREFNGHIEQYDGASFVDCVVAGTADGVVKLFKVKNKVNLKLQNSSLLPTSSSDAKIESTPQIVPDTGNLKDKPRRTQEKKQITEILKIIKHK